MLDKELERLIQIEVNALFLTGLRYERPGAFDYKKLVEETDYEGSASMFPIFESMLQGFNEWIGDREYVELQFKKYQLNNVDFERSIRIKRLDLQNSGKGGMPDLKRFGIDKLGAAAKMDIIRRSWDLLLGGLEQPCYNGQTFFSATHPSLDGNGTFANLFGIGGGQPRYWILDLGNISKPFVKNIAIEPDVEYDGMTLKKQKHAEVLADYAGGYGYSYPQLAATAENAINEANVVEIMTSMANTKGPDGKNLGVFPTHIVTETANYTTALALFSNLNANGGSNGLSGQLEVVKHPFL